MINKATLAVVAALLAGTASNAFASAADNDANTGLWSTLYYGTLADLQKQGAPMSPAAVKYLKEHPQAQVQTRGPQGAKRGNGVFLLEDTQGIVAPRQTAPYYNNDFQSGHMW